MKIWTILLFYAFVSCSNPAGQSEVKTTLVAEKYESIPELQKENRTETGNTRGVVVLNDNYSETDTVKLYNEDGSLWYKFTYFYDDSDGEFDYPNDEFQPYAFHPDNFILGLTAVEESQKKYIVIVNESTGLKKQINKDDFLQLISWEQYVLVAFSVGFNPKKNPIHKEPVLESETISYQENSLYHPVKVHDEWLQVKWGKEGDWNFGWIKWKERNKLLIQIYYNA